MTYRRSIGLVFDAPTASQRFSPSLIYPPDLGWIPIFKLDRDCGATPARTHFIPRRDSLTPMTLPLVGPFCEREE